MPYYSNDMGKVGSTPTQVSQNPPLPLYQNNKVIETEPDQRLLTKAEGSTHIATSMDLYPTILNLEKAQVPKDRELDGRDIRDLT